MKLETSKKAQVTPQSIVHTTQKAKIDTSMSDLIMDMLSKIYANPLTAAIREYVSNGVDAHTAVGQTKPVEVTLPTAEENTLIIRDYGKGMDMFDILTIYGNFGTSDKRDSDDFIGGFGIGSKSGLAISDIIDVESVKDGMMNKFRIKRQGQEIITQFVEENVPATNQDSGTKITIDVEPSYVNNISAKDIDIKGRNNPARTYHHPVRDYMQVLAGWPKSAVIAKCTNTQLAEICNDHRIPDTWHEFDNGYIANAVIESDFALTSGFMVGNVFYSPIVNSSNFMDSDVAIKATIRGFRSQCAVLKLDIASTKVAYSREQIEYNGSEATRMHVKERLKGLYKEIQDAVLALQNDPNFQPEIYIRKLMAMGIAVDEASYDYAKFLNRTPAFDFGADIDIDDIDMFQTMEVYKSSEDDITVGKYDPRYGEKPKHDSVKDRIVFVIEANSPKRAPATNRKYVQDAYREYKASGNDINGAMASVDQFASRHRTRWPREANVAYIMTQDMLDKFAYKPFAITIKFQDVIDLATMGRQNKRVQRQVNKNLRVYVKNSTYSPELKETKDIENSIVACVLPVKSAHAFNTTNAGIKTSVIQNLLGMPVIAMQRVCDYDTIKKEWPNAWYPTDNELENVLHTIVDKYAWAANDTFCRCFASDGEQQLSYWDQGEWKPVDIPAEIDNHLPVVKKCANHPAHIKDILKSISCGAPDDPLLKALDETARNANSRGAYHKETYNFRMLATLCDYKKGYGAMSYQSRRTMLSLAEIQNLAAVVAQEYADEIKHLKLIYN